jgi:hypothetical protein
MSQQVGNDCKKSLVGVMSSTVGGVLISRMTEHEDDDTGSLGVYCRTSWPCP